MYRLRTMDRYRSFSRSACSCHSSARSPARRGQHCGYVSGVWLEALEALQCGGEQRVADAGGEHGDQDSPARGRSSASPCRTACRSLAGTWWMASLITIASSRSPGSVMRRSAMSWAEARTGMQGGVAGELVEHGLGRVGADHRGWRLLARRREYRPVPQPMSATTCPGRWRRGRGCTWSSRRCRRGCRPSSRRSWRPAGRSGPGRRRRGCWSWCSWRFS